MTHQQEKHKTKSCEPEAQPGNTYDDNQVIDRTVEVEVSTTSYQDYDLAYRISTDHISPLWRIG